jgi:hypothetical protein
LIYTLRPTEGSIRVFLISVKYRTVSGLSQKVGGIDNFSETTLSFKNEKS